MINHYTPMQYLKIDIANLGPKGLDKAQFEERIQWVDDNMDTLESFQEENIEDYYQYAVAVQALRDTQKGIPTGHMVALDACSQGPAILSTLVGDKTGAASVELTGDKRKDVYCDVTDVMENLLNKPVQFNAGDYTDEEGETVTIEADRDAVKFSFMPFFYGSNGEPKKVFGDDTREHRSFLKATAVICPGASYLRESIIGLSDSEAMEYACTYPDLFKMVYRVKDSVEDKIEIDTLPKHPVFTMVRTINAAKDHDVALVAHVTHGCDGFIVREIIARCGYDRDYLKVAARLLIERLKKDIYVEHYLPIEAIERKTQFTSIAGLDYLNETTVNQMTQGYCERLLKLVQRLITYRTFPVLTVHDSFHCHANHMDNCRAEYMEIFCALADSVLLDAVLSELTGDEITIEKMSDDLSDDIREGTYWLS